MSERKTALTFEEKITAAHLHYVQAIDQHVIAFARIGGEKAALTVASRLTSEVEAGTDEANDWWGSTAIHLPEPLSGRSWRAVVTGKDVTGRDELLVADLLRPLPVAVLMS